MSQPRVRDQRPSASRDGRLPMSIASFKSRLRINYGELRERTIAPAVEVNGVTTRDRRVQDDEGRSETPTSFTVVGVDGLPKGFGQLVTWTGQEDLAIVAVINCSDPLGLSITGLRDTDTFELVSARGVGSFAVETRNEGLPGLISVVTAGANLTATSLGAPQAKELIDAVGKFAADRFPESEQKAKYRDAFGQDKHLNTARQEGGVLICEPQAGCQFFSGDEDHKDMWVQGSDRGKASNLPRHIQSGEAFFLTNHKGRRELTGDGSMFLMTWDQADAFSDNTGFYEVQFILRRGSGRDTSTPVPRIGARGADVSSKRLDRSHLRAP